MKTSLLLIWLCYTCVASGQGTNCSTAITLPVDSVSRSYSVSSSTGACIFCSTNGFNGTNGRVTYFKFTTDSSPQCVLVDVTAQAGVTVELVLYDICALGIPAPIGGLYNHNMCMSNGSGIWAQNLFDNLSPNTTYYMRVRTEGGYTGSLQVMAKYYTPPNSNCLGATSISTNVSVADNNACHRPGNVPATQLCATTLENTAWYTFVVQGNGNSTITIDNIQCNNGDGNSNNGFQIGFFQGTCSSLIPITCSSGSGGTVTATATGLTGGTRIYVGIDGYSGSNCSYTINATNANPLPVRMRSFTGEEKPLSNLLRWETEQEFQNAYFEIQRSTDARNFQAIGRLPGQGSSTVPRAYSFDDNRPVASAYYRIKQVDIDGHFSYSNIVELTRYKKVDQQLSAVKYLDGEISFLYRDAVQGTIDIHIYSLQGTLVYNTALNHTKGLNTISRSGLNISPGSYVLAIYKDGRRISTLFTAL